MKRASHGGLIFLALLAFNFMPHRSHYIPTAGSDRDHDSSELPFFISPIVTNIFHNNRHQTTHHTSVSSQPSPHHLHTTHHTSVSSQPSPHHPHTTHHTSVWSQLAPHHLHTTHHTIFTNLTTPVHHKYWHILNKYVLF